MKVRNIVANSSIFVLSACNASGIKGTGGANTGFIEDLPEAVIAMAAPYQDLEAVRLLPEDGCYWYQHVGPVETTMLPLITVRGNKICTRPRSEPIATS
jgi:hypothetical protein